MLKLLSDYMLVNSNFEVPCCFRCLLLRMIVPVTDDDDVTGALSGEGVLVVAASAIVSGQGFSSLLAVPCLLFCQHCCYYCNCCVWCCFLLF